MMMDVACFCGCVYSFSSDLSVCPNCGEYVTLSRAAPEEEEQMRSELDAVLRPHNAPVVPDLTAAELVAESAGSRRAHRVLLAAGPGRGKDGPPQ